MGKRDQSRRDLGRPRASSEAATGPFRYTNRKGQTYYLHAGKTKTGKRRYFVAKTAGDGVLDAVPSGFEVVESINGVVSVRRIDPDARSVPETDLARVRAELGRHHHLRRYRVDAIKGEIIVFEPIGGLPDEVADRLVATLQLTPWQFEQRRPELDKGVRYTPVLRLVPLDGRQYALFRMTYRGEGGWSPWAIARGTIAALASKYLPYLGTQAFFDLY
jgi:hypothetical protein